LRLTGLHIGELIAEIAPLLLGGQIREVQPVPPRDLLLIVGEPEDTGEGRVRRLRIASSPDAPRLHLQVGRVHKHDGALGPFYRSLDEALAGARLVAVEQVGGDRIVRLDFAAGPPVSGLKLAQNDPRSLLAELTGRHANMVLLDRDGRVLISLVEPKPGSRAAERSAPGQIWQAPPGRPASPETASEEKGEATLEESFPVPGAPETSRGIADLAPLSWRIEASLGALADEAWTNGLRRDLTQRLERRLKNARSNLRGLEERERQSGRVERERQDGDLLKSALARFRRGDAQIELEDYFSDGTPLRRIALDPKLSPKENVARIFARVKKLERQSAKLPQEIGLAEEKVKGLEALLLRAGNEDPEALDSEAVSGGWLKQRQEKAPKERRKAPEARLPYLVFRGLGGGEIRVGRNARDNDRLTFKESRGNDLWIHTADCPGSHVVIRLERGAEAHPEDLLDAAHLAIHYSPVRGTNSSSVHIAHCKDIKKPRRAPAGLVTLSSGKVRKIRVEQERLERLLDTRK
jgi:predicted ribosome quality control (RQC) complex YloA/Tae2 family protein